MTAALAISTVVQKERGEVRYSPNYHSVQIDDLPLIDRHVNREKGHDARRRQTRSEEVGSDVDLTHALLTPVDVDLSRARTRNLNGGLSVVGDRVNRETYLDTANPSRRRNDYLGDGIGGGTAGRIQF